MWHVMDQLSQVQSKKTTEDGLPPQNGCSFVTLLLHQLSILTKMVQKTNKQVEGKDPTD